MPEPVLVPEPPAEVELVFDDSEEAADETVDVAELVVPASEEVTWLTVETTVETTEVGLGGGGGGGGGGDGDVGSGTLVVGSGTLVDVGSGTVVDVGSGTEVLVGSGTVVVVRSGGGSPARAVGAASVATATQKRTVFDPRRLICGYNPARARTVAGQASSERLGVSSGQARPLTVRGHWSGATTADRKG